MVSINEHYANEQLSVYSMESVKSDNTDHKTVTVSNKSSHIVKCIE